MLTLDRRSLISGALIAPAALVLPGVALGATAGDPPAITSAERLARLAKARALMRRDGLGAILIEPGASLDYFTGVRWSRSERLTAALIPAVGDPIIVTPFFEKPSVAESLAIPAEIRTWDEHEEQPSLSPTGCAKGTYKGSRSGSRKPTASSSSIACKRSTPGSGCAMPTPSSAGAGCSNRPPKSP